MRYQYKVVPFIGQSKGGLSPTDVAKQLEAVIRQHAVDGWEFYQLSDVNVEVQPGCIAGLFGARTEYMRFDQLIFRGAPDSSDLVHPGTAFSERPPTEVARPNMDLPGEVKRTELGSEPYVATKSSSRLQDLWRQKSDEELRQAAATPQHFTDSARQALEAELAFRKSVSTDPAIAQDGQESDAFCYHCGSDIERGSAVCSSCGKAL